MGGLAVYVDGTPLPDDEARAFWQRFSDWMEEHRGDLAGFAAREGFASVHPGVLAGGPVLHASRSAAQRPYAPAASGPGPGGSENRQGGPRREQANPKKSHRKSRR